MANSDRLFKKSECFFLRVYYVVKLGIEALTDGISEFSLSTPNCFSDIIKLSGAGQSLYYSAVVQSHNSQLPQHAGTEDSGERLQVVI